MKFVAQELSSSYQNIPSTIPDTNDKNQNTQSNEASTNSPPDTTNNVHHNSTDINSINPNAISPDVNFKELNVQNPLDNEDNFITGCVKCCRRQSIVLINSHINNKIYVLILAM